MRSVKVILLTLLIPWTAHAEPQLEQPAASTPQPELPVESPAAADSLRLQWHERYLQARAALVAEQFEPAATAFRALTDSATNPEDKRMASELATIAQAGVERHVQPEPQPALRTSDELAVLYTTAVFYGLGTSGWLALQLQPKTFGGALLPFAVLTPAAVGIVAVADSYRPLRHGIPHAIAAGLYLGFGEGLWVVGYQHAYASAHDGVAAWHSERVSTALWAGSTAGALVGGLIGAWRRPTPGRVSFTASAGIWGGVLSSIAASAIQPERKRRGESAYLAGAVGYNVGLIAGVLFGPEVAPSVARVRFIDLGGLGGALLGAGGYALLANQRESRGSMAAASIGGALGLGLAWWATSGMPADRSHDTLGPAIGRGRAGGFSSLSPMLMPTRDGFMATIAGAL